MTTIKLFSSMDDRIIMRQSPNQNGCWKDIRLLPKDSHEDYDWWYPPNT